jgi:hypothetical protein
MIRISALALVSNAGLVLLCCLAKPPGDKPLQDQRKQLVSARGMPAERVLRYSGSPMRCTASRTVSSTATGQLPKYGDAAAQAERAWIALAAGTNLHLRECMTWFAEGRRVPKNGQHFPCIAHLIRYKLSI